MKQKRESKVGKENDKLISWEKNSKERQYVPEVEFF